jgi:NifU-like protein
VSFYPKRISRRFYDPQNSGKPENANGVGTGASGTFVRFLLEIDAETKTIKQAKFKSSGCGFAVAAADVLTEKILDCRLTDLHGLDKNELKGEIETRLEEFPEHRAHCREMCFDALRAALADFRSFQIEEFAGEKLLICTCFGVSEEEIEKVIEEYQAVSVEEVSDVCNAGTGCGSCQFLIQEMIDIYWTENV